MRGIKISDIQVRDTGVLFGLVSILIGLYTVEKIWFFAASGILLVTLLIPSLLKPLAWVWFGFSKILGWVTSRVVLLVIFLGLVTPIGLIRRVFGKDPLRLSQFKNGDKSVFVERNHEFSSSDLKYSF